MTSYVEGTTYFSRGHEKWMLFLQHNISRPRHKDVVTSTKWSRGHNIISHSQELICRGHDKTKWTEDGPSQSPVLLSRNRSEYSSSVFVYTGFRNSATTLCLFVQQQLLHARDLSSNLIGRPISSQSDGEKKRHTGQKKKSCFFAPQMIVPGVNSPIVIWMF